MLRLLLAATQEALLARNGNWDSTARPSRCFPTPSVMAWTPYWDAIAMEIVAVRKSLPITWPYVRRGCGAL